MKGVIVRRKRLEDGTFGELEKVMGGETEEERLNRIEAESAAAMNAIVMLFEQQQPEGGESDE